MRRRQGTTMVEMFFALGMLTGLILFVLQLTVVARRWRETATGAASSFALGERLRAILVDASLGARPVAVLSVAPSGEVAERAIEGAQVFAAGRSLVLAGRDRYDVFSLEGAHLVQRRIARSGRVERSILVEGVTEARLQPVKKDGRDVGIEYRVVLARAGAPLSGFVALRIDDVPRPSFEAAPPAPRWTSRGAR